MISVEFSLKSAEKGTKCYLCQNYAKHVFNYKLTLKRAKTVKDSNLVWVDCEMTGLDPNKDHLLEIAVIVTDKDLNVLAEGPNLVIHQSDEVWNH